MTRAIRNGGRLPFNEGSPYRNVCSATWAAAAIRTIIATSAMPANHCRMDRRNTDSAKKSKQKPLANIKCVTWDATAHQAISIKVRRSPRERLSRANTSR